MKKQADPDTRNAEAALENKEPGMEQEKKDTGVRAEAEGSKVLLFNC